MKKKVGLPHQKSHANHPRLHRRGLSARGQTAYQGSASPVPPFTAGMDAGPAFGPDAGAPTGGAPAPGGAPAMPAGPDAGGAPGGAPGGM